MVDLHEAHIRVFLMESPSHGVIARSDHNNLATACSNGTLNFLFDMDLACQVVGDDSWEKEMFTEFQHPTEKAELQTLAKEVI